MVHKLLIEGAHAVVGRVVQRTVRVNAEESHVVAHAHHPCPSAAVKEHLRHRGQVLQFLVVEARHRTLLVHHFQRSLHAARAIGIRYPQVTLRVILQSAHASRRQLVRVRRYRLQRTVLMVVVSHQFTIAELVDALSERRCIVMGCILRILHDACHVLVVHSRLFGDALLLKRGPLALLIHHQRTVKEGLVKVVEASTRDEQPVVAGKVQVLAVVAHRAVGYDGPSQVGDLLGCIATSIFVEAIRPVAGPQDRTVDGSIGRRAIQFHHVEGLQRGIDIYVRGITHHQALVRGVHIAECSLAQRSRRSARRVHAIYRLVRSQRYQHTVKGHQLRIVVCAHAVPVRDVQQVVPRIAPVETLGRSGKYHPIQFRGTQHGAAQRVGVDKHPPLHIQHRETEVRGHISLSARYAQVVYHRIQCRLVGIVRDVQHRAVRMQQVDVRIVVHHHQRARRLVQCDVAYTLVTEDSCFVIRLHVLVARGV